MSPMQSKAERLTYLRIGRVVLAATALACLCLGGCAKVRLNMVAMGPPACLNDPVPLDAVVLKHFRHVARAHFGLFGLITWRDVPFERIIAEQREMYGGNGIINVTISGRFGLWDVILGLPLGPFWLRRTYVIEGDVVILGPP